MYSVAYDRENFGRVSDKKNANTPRSDRDQNPHGHKLQNTWQSCQRKIHYCHPLLMI